MNHIGKVTEKVLILVLCLLLQGCFFYKRPKCKNGEIMRWTLLDGYDCLDLSNPHPHWDCSMTGLKCPIHNKKKK